MGDITKSKTHRVDHGLCPICGEEAAPYYLCGTHRRIRTLNRLLNRMAKHNIVLKGKDRGQNTWSIPQGGGQKFEDFPYHPTAFEMDPADKRFRPRMGRRPVDIDETLFEIFRDAGKPLYFEEILTAWGKLRSRRKHGTLASDMTTIIECQRKQTAKAERRARNAGHRPQASADA